MKVITEPFHKELRTHSTYGILKYLTETQGDVQVQDLIISHLSLASHVEFCIEWPNKVSVSILISARS